MAIEYIFILAIILEPTADLLKFIIFVQCIFLLLFFSYHDPVFFLNNKTNKQNDDDDDYTDKLCVMISFFFFRLRLYVVSNAYWYGQTCEIPIGAPKDGNVVHSKTKVCLS